MKDSITKDNRAAGSQDRKNSKKSTCHLYYLTPREEPLSQQPLQTRDMSPKPWWISGGMTVASQKSKTGLYSPKISKQKDEMK